MLKLKLIPRFRCILSSFPGAKSVTRGFSAGAGGEGGDDGDFFSRYLSQTPSPSERSRDNRSSRGFGRQGPQFGSRGGGSGVVGGSGRGARAGRGRGVRGGRFGSPFGIDDDDELAAPPQLTEEELKEMKELEEKVAAMPDDDDEKKVEDDDDEDEIDDGEVKSIYAGFIDPRYDDVIKEQKRLQKRLQYKDTSGIDEMIVDEDDDITSVGHDIEGSERTSRQERQRQGQGQGAFNAKAEEEETSEGSDDETSEDEVDEEEWEMMDDMTSMEFERHLKHRRHGRKLREEYESRIADLGDEDFEEVKKVQKLMMKKWRASYRMPRMVTPLEKEDMWKKHKENPEEWTVDKLAEEFEVCKARVHAILFLWDIRKQQGEKQSAEEETKQYLDNLCFDDNGEPCLPPHMGEDKWITTWNTRPNYKIMPADWEGSVRTEEDAIEEASAKEEAMMLDEFVRRLEFNKLQMAGLFKQNKYERRRPPGGWTYLVEKLGPEGKRGKRGGYKFVATADGKHRKLNDLEKLVLKREAVRPRKRIL